jgi:hypothetical protein
MSKRFKDCRHWFKSRTKWERWSRRRAWIKLTIMMWVCCLVGHWAGDLESRANSTSTNSTRTQMIHRLTLTPSRFLHRARIRRLACSTKLEIKSRTMWKDSKIRRNTWVLSRILMRSSATNRWSIIRTSTIRKVHLLLRVVPKWEILPIRLKVHLLLKDLVPLATQQMIHVFKITGQKIWTFLNPLHRINILWFHNPRRYIKNSRRLSHMRAVNCKKHHLTSHQWKNVSI